MVSDIAIIGISCALPKSDDQYDYWDNLNKGKVCLQDINDIRWNYNEKYKSTPDKLDNIYCPKMGIVDDFKKFDNTYFNINDEDCYLMDTQQKKLLECAKKLIDDSGYAKGDFYGKYISVFVGSSFAPMVEYNSFLCFAQGLNEDIQKEIKKEYTFPENKTNIMLSSIQAMLSGRIANYFNLKGPSLSIDTACSSSLVALHYACKSIIYDGCEMAICGGVCSLETVSPMLGFSYAKALSPSGRLSTFDENADGFVPGEGVGLLLLKPLDKAMADNDKIYAVIKGSTVNNDGRTISPMLPNPKAQRSVIEKFYENCDIKPSDINYIEAHGTGTKVGDLSEFNSLKRAFLDYGNNNKCYIGSVKANIGHLLSASGVASIIKVIGMMKENKIYQQASFDTPNNKLEFQNSRFEIPKENIDLEELNYVGVNAFAFGGTNAHIVLENGKKYQHNTLTESYASLPFIIGGHNREVLEQNKIKIFNYLEKTQDKFEDIVFTMDTINHEHKYITAFEANNIKDILSKIMSKEYFMRDNVDTAFLFSGQGSQYLGMAKEIYNKIPLFKKYIDLCAKLFSDYGGIDVLSAIHNCYSDNEKDINDTRIAQAVIFTINYSFASLLIFAGYKPAYLIGHSVGEWVAAVISGVVTIDEGIQIIVKRSNLMISIKDEGKMLAVFSKYDDIKREITYGNTYICAKNISHIVVGGKSNDIMALKSKLQEKKIYSILLNVSGAFHTHLLKDIAKEFEQFLNKFEFKKPKYKIISNVTGEIIEEYTPFYWGEHLVKPVLFEESIALVTKTENLVFVECGGNNILSAMIKTKYDNKCISLISEGKDGLNDFNKSLCQLVKYSSEFKIYKIFSGVKYNKPCLPTYPFGGKINCIMGERKTKYGQNIDIKKTNEPVAKIDIDKIINDELAIPIIKKENLKQILYGIIGKFAKGNITRNNEDLNFMELGIESLDVAELTEKIYSQTKIKIYPTVLFEFQTPRELLEHLEETIILEEIKEIREIKDIREIKEIREIKDIRDIIKIKKTEGIDYKKDSDKENDEIVIVGTGIISAQIESVDDFWQILIDGENVFRNIPEERFVFKETEKQLFGGYIDNVFDFDPIFFGISPNEAKFIDPQQKKFLQVALQALQEANAYGEFRDKNIGVYVGGDQNNYGDLFIHHRVLNRLEKDTGKKIHIDTQELNADAVIGNSLNEVAGRASYTFGLTGPSLFVNTACSSSLVALNIAISDIRNNVVSSALVGGVNINISDTYFVGMDKMNAISKTNGIYPFDEKSDGTVLGEAVVAIVLKKRSKAIEDGDYIYGILKDVAVNNNGFSQGITVPTIKGQKEVMKNVIDKQPNILKEIVYIEAHGTGTPMGDPIEVSSILQAYDGVENDCYIGSNKGSIGHTLASSGLVSIVKCLKIFENDIIPKSSGFHRQNKQLDFINNTKFSIADKNININKIDYAIGVNAFGFGGTNVHAVLKKDVIDIKENGEILSLSEGAGRNILLLSSYYRDGIKKLAKYLLDKFDRVNWLSLIKKINCNAKIFNFRAVILFSDFDDLVEKLSDFIIGKSTNILIGKATKNNSRFIDARIPEYIEVDLENNQYIENLWRRGAECKNIESFRLLLCHVTGKKVRFTHDNLDIPELTSERRITYDNLLDILGSLYIMGNSIDLRGLYKGVKQKNDICINNYRLDTYKVDNIKIKYKDNNIKNIVFKEGLQKENSKQNNKQDFILKEIRYKKELSEEEKRKEINKLKNI